MSRKGKSTKGESRIAVAQPWGGGWEWGGTANGQKVSFGGDGNVLKLGREMVAQLYAFTVNIELCA